MFKKETLLYIFLCTARIFFFFIILLLLTAYNKLIYLTKVFLEESFQILRGEARVFTLGGQKMKLIWRAKYKEILLQGYRHNFLL